MFQLSGFYCRGFGSRASSLGVRVSGLRGFFSLGVRG